MTELSILADKVYAQLASRFEAIPLPTLLDLLDDDMQILTSKFEVSLEDSRHDVSTRHVWYVLKVRWHEPVASAAASVLYFKVDAEYDSWGQTYIDWDDLYHVSLSQETNRTVWNRVAPEPFDVHNSDFTSLIEHLKQTTGFSSPSALLDADWDELTDKIGVRCGIRELPDGKDFFVVYVGRRFIKFNGWADSYSLNGLETYWDEAVEVTPEQVIETRWDPVN